MAGPRRRRDDPIEPGARIDKYQLVRHIGRGATGTVWLARHRILANMFAIKFLDADDRQLPAALQSELRGRFALEARVAALVGAETTRVVRAVDAGEHLGVPYLVMELVEGPSLADRIVERGRLTPGDVADVVDQLAEGLDALHAAGFLHRDVKPANVVCSRLSPSIEVKLTDLGIVRRIDGSIASGPVTDAGIALGSPTYMSPEHIEEGRAVGRASDLWSLGVTAYEALCGDVPFGGAALPQIVEAIRSQRARSPRSRVPELPIELDAFFQRTFAIDPERRWNSGEQMAAALRKALSTVLQPPVPKVAAEPVVEVKPAPTRRRSRRPRALLIVAPLVLVAASAAFAFTGGWLAPPPRPEPPTEQPAAARPGGGGSPGAVSTTPVGAPPLTAAPTPATSASASHRGKRRSPAGTTPAAHPDPAASAPAPAATPDAPAPRRQLDPSEVF